jgi:uncharacterized protein YjiS (DUF1127 family)
LHKTHCCHATYALLKSGRCHYLSIATEIDNNKPFEDTTMNLIRNYRNWRRYRDTVGELNRLSNRELNDLGITRGDIPFVARRSA